MKHDNLLLKYNQLVFLRNALVGITFLLLVVVILLSIKLVVKDHTVIITPSHINYSYKISQSKVSRQYLDDMAREVVSIALNITPSNTQFIEKTFLKMVHPSAYGKTKNAIHQQMRDIIKRKVSNVFYPVSIYSNEKKFTSEVVGDFHTYIGQKEVGSERQTYHIKFSYEGGSLKVKEFYLKEEDNEKSSL